MTASASYFTGWASRRLPKLLPGGKPDKLPVTLHRRRIYILPTRYGLFFGLLLFVMLLGALNYNNNLALLLSFLLGGLALLATVHTYRNLAGLQVSACNGEPVFAGENAGFTVTLVNPERRPRCAVRAQYEDHDAAVDLSGETSGELRLSLPTERRGWQPISRVRLYTVFPLGLFRAWSWLGEPGRVLVYPEPEPAPVPSPYGQQADAASRLQDGDEFTGLRAYRDGDPSRLIAWKALARSDELMSKEFHAPHQGVLWLDFNALDGLDTEARLSRLTRWVLDARHAKVRFGLKLPGQELPPNDTPAHQSDCLRALALFATT